VTHGQPVPNRRPAPKYKSCALVGNSLRMLLDTKHGALVGCGVGASWLGCRSVGITHLRSIRVESGSVESKRP